MVLLQASVTRCSRKAFDGKRIWTCRLYRGHDGNCFAPRWDLERPFEDDWTIVFKDDYTPPAPVVAPPEPEPPKFVPSPVREHDGKRPKRKHRNNVFAAPGMGVTSGVRWSGHEIDYPSTADLDDVRMNW